MNRAFKMHSRRDFLATMAGAGASLLLSPRQLPAAEIDPQVSQLVASTIAVDMHNHVVIPYTRIPANATPDPQLDISAEIKRSGFSAVCQTFAVDDLYTRKAGEYYQYFRSGLDFEDRELEKNHMGRALNMKDLQAAHDQGQPIVIQAAEGSQFLEGHLDRLEEAYRRGVRVLQPVHNDDDLVAPLGDTYTSPTRFGGLTPLGARFIKECNRLGIVVDLQHASLEMAKAAIAIATQPVLFSHTAVAHTAAARYQTQMTKEEAQLIVETGGVIGIWWRAGTSVPEYVKAIADMVTMAGIDHVGLGTDSVLPLPNPLYNIPSTNDLWVGQNGGFFFAVAAEMLKQGFHASEIRKIGGENFCRVFAKVTNGST